MTDILESPVASALDDDSPLARLFAMVDDEYTEDEQRDDAEIAAAHHVYNAYGATIGQVLDGENWDGKIALRDNRLEASAVAYLDGGLWLHHSSDVDQERDVLTLIAPCTCGNGYIDTVLDGESDLLQVLTDLRATGGRFPHNSDDPDCDSQRRLHDWSNTRP